MTATTLGIDLGTSELKLALVDEQGRLLATASEPLTVSRPQPHWAEQAPQDWWEALLRVAGRLRDDQPAAWAAVQGIGLSGQMHGAVLLDASHAVLRPAILWCDARSGPQCDVLARRRPDLADLAGNLPMPGLTAPKLLWVEEHEPHLHGRIAKVLLPKDWLRWRLAGEFISDMSDAAGTLWLDVGARAWSDALLSAGGMKRAQMPRLVEGSEIAGHLDAGPAQSLGLRPGLPLAGGGGDNAASAVGIGAISAGQGFVSLGTSGVVFVVADRYRPNAAHAVHTFCHALPGRWHQMSVMLSAANGLKWVTQLTGSANEAHMLSLAAGLTDIERQRAPLFLPYLSGERTPHNDPHAQGAFFGLNNDTDAARLGHSVIEGVGFGLADGLHALRATGTRIDRLCLVGGGARSAHWAQLLADTLDIELATVDGSHAGGAVGAARLAWLALGRDERSVCPSPPAHAEFMPNAGRHAALMPRLQRFRALYEQTRSLNIHD